MKSISIICSCAILDDVAPLLNVASLDVEVNSCMSASFCKADGPYLVILMVVILFLFANSISFMTSIVCPENEMPTRHPLPLSLLSQLQPYGRQDKRLHFY